MVYSNNNELRREKLRSHLVSLGSNEYLEMKFSSKTDTFKHNYLIEKTDRNTYIVSYTFTNYLDFGSKQRKLELDIFGVLDLVNTSA